LIRPFRFSDSLFLQRLIRQSASLQLERHLTQPYSPLWAALGAPLPWHGSGAGTYLHIPNETAPQIDGFIQAIKRPARAEADITYIAPLLSAAAPVDVVWSSLLEYVASAAGEHGIQRLYLCIASDDPGCELVSNSGYTPYIRETLFRLASAPETDPAQKTNPHIRFQREGDSLALQRLVSRYSPPVVQKAEGMFASNDDAPSPLALRSWWQPEHTEGLVFEEQGEIIAAAHIQHGNSGHWLRLFGDPGTTEVMAELLSHSLKTLSHYRNRPVYCAIRPYQSRFGPLLQAQHFAPEQEITRFVKHTTSFIKRPALQRAHEAIEGKMPGLIPTDFSLKQSKKVTANLSREKDTSRSR
jgi:hypothetical protein